jgi:hypothetical protein
MQLLAIWLLSSLDRQVTRDKVGAIKTLVINLATASLNIWKRTSMRRALRKSRSLRIRKLLLEVET